MWQVGNLPPRGKGAVASSGKRDDLLLWQQDFILLHVASWKLATTGEGCRCVGWEAWRPSYVATRFHLVACGMLKTCHHGGRVPLHRLGSATTFFCGNKISSCCMRQVENLPPQGQGAAASSGKRDDLLLWQQDFILLHVASWKLATTGAGCRCIGWEAWRPSFVATRFHLVACGKLKTCHHRGRCASASSGKRDDLLLWQQDFILLHVAS